MSRVACVLPKPDPQYMQRHTRQPAPCLRMCTYFIKSAPCVT